MSAHDAAIETHQVGSTKLFATVWFWLLLTTGVEVFLAYLRLAPVLMLTILVGLSLIKAALIVSYFMHLRFERLGLFLLLVPRYSRFAHLTRRRRVARCATRTPPRPERRAAKRCATAFWFFCFLP